MRASPWMAIGMAALLAGCGTPPREAGFEPVPPPPTTTTSTAPAGCDPTTAGFAMGRPYSDALAEQVQRATGARLMRVIRPGQMVTRDFRADRINLDLDAAGTVIRAHCG